MELREHQQLALDQIRQSIRAGNKRIMVGAPTAFGKTILAAHIAKSAAENGNKVYFVCDRIKLIQQSLEKFDAHALDLGVIQGMHERYNPDAMIQIASVQTLMRRSTPPDGRIYIIDEAHIHYKWVEELMSKYNRCIFIGLSATPYTKGLGNHYQALINPISTRELIAKNYLCPPKYYIGHAVDVTKIGTQSLSTGGSEYAVKDLAHAVEIDDVLTGDIIRNWLQHGEDSQTIAFSPSIKQSKWLVDQFNAKGVSAEHIDGYMDEEERDYLYRAHDRGEFKILSCSRLLNTGYDSPTTRCLIDCFPTKSLISYVQRVGRILRTSEGKDYAIYLDHAGNVQRHGLQEDIVPESLDDGEKQYNERELTQEKKEPKIKACPSCYQPFTGMGCACGYEIPARDRMEHDGTNLVLLKRSDMTAAEKRNADTKQGDKQDFLAGLILHGQGKGYKAGWAANQYKERFGDWPSVDPSNIKEIPLDVKKHIQGMNIRRAKSKHYIRQIRESLK